MKKLRDLKKVLSNLEAEGQGRGFIMGVTRLLLLGPFYTIQMQFSILFCTRLYATNQDWSNEIGYLNHFVTKGKVCESKLKFKQKFILN